MTLSHIASLPQLTPLSKPATFVLANATETPVGQANSPDPPPPAICYLKLITSPIPSSLPSPPLCGIYNVTNNTRLDTSDPAPSDSSSSIFPVTGPFDLLYLLQTGAFGSAWAAKDQSTGRLLCIKAFRSLRERGVTNSVQTELRLFRRIAKSKAGQRGKQFIMELNRSIQHGTNVFFAMELMSTDLSMYLYFEPERCEQNASRWIAQLALGIQSLHEMGILHRDIKCENILIDSRENVRIIDFGLAYLGPSGKPLMKGTKYTTDLLGTAPYMAPEVLRNKGTPAQLRRPYGTEVDWWALGCILFELESHDHKVLFDTEEDLHAYVTWTRIHQARWYAKFQGLDPVVADLLQGLLEVHSLDRYSLNDMEKHDYFHLHDGASEFDYAAARALERPICPELVPQPNGEEGPGLVIQAAKSRSIYDWTNLKWARP